MLILSKNANTNFIGIFSSINLFVRYRRLSLLVFLWRLGSILEYDPTLARWTLLSAIRLMVCLYAAVRFLYICDSEDRNW